MLHTVLCYHLVSVIGTNCCIELKAASDQLFVLSAADKWEYVLQTAFWSYSTNYVPSVVSLEMSFDINKGIHLTCFFGMGLSYYAYVVETTKEHDGSYVAMCDISEHMSCSKAFMSS